MKTEIILDILPRSAGEKPAALRAKGVMPAVYYGRKRQSTPVSVSAAQFLKVWKKAGESSVVTLKTKDGPLDSLIYDVDLDPVTSAPRHADFYVFEKGQKIKVKIPLEFQGIAPAVKDLGGVLVKVLHEVEVESAPKDLPHALFVDISKLATFQSQVLAKDITLPDGVTLAQSPDGVVASVYEPKEEVVEEAPVDLSAIEVEKKGKKEEEGVPVGEAAAAPAAAKAPAKPTGK